MQAALPISASREHVRYRRDGAVVTITLDDGKVNALTPRMLADLGAALDRAGRDGGTVVLGGREGVFSAGFDLGVLRAGGPDAAAMVLAGFAVAERLMAFPAPVVIACSGHAVAMGAFLLLAADHRIGVEGPYTITANEVAIGLTLPHAAIELLRHRLQPAAFQQAALLAAPFSPDAAVRAGFLDQLVPPDRLAADAADAAAEFADRLNPAAHAATKGRVRSEALAALRAAIAADAASIRPS